MKHNDQPKGILLNRTELSHAFGIAPTTVDTWVRAGMPIHKKAAARGNQAQYDTAACLNWIRRNRCHCR